MMKEETTSSGTSGISGAVFPSSSVSGFQDDRCGDILTDHGAALCYGEVL